MVASLRSKVPICFDAASHEIRSHRGSHGIGPPAPHFDDQYLALKKHAKHQKLVATKQVDHVFNKAKVWNIMKNEPKVWNIMEP